MKSAYERALEKLGDGGEKAPKLSEAQKKEIAELNSLYESKIAERQTFLQSKISEAHSKGDEGEASELESQLARDTAALRDELEEKKNKIWKQSDAK